MDVPDAQTGRPFEDTIDGYFPLRVSLMQMMDRQRFARAWIRLRHAPILMVPGLAWDAPVPLNIGAGHAGLIDDLTLWIDKLTQDVAGWGCWRWLAPEAPAGPMDPMTRLAEPAFIDGVGLTASDRCAPLADITLGDDPRDVATGSRLWGPLPDPGSGITARISSPHFMALIDETTDLCALPPGRYLSAPRQIGR